MLAFSSCLQPFQRPLGRRAELQEQVPWDEVVSASAPSRFSPRAASRGPGALGARSLALEVYLLWASRSAKSRRNARAVWCSPQRSRSGPASAIVMRNQEIESSVGAAQEEDAGEDQDTKQKLLQRLRQEVSGSHQLVARIFLSASSDLRHEMLELIAEETMALPVENFRGLLRALRKADVSPENIVQLYQRVQPWFMEQKPNEEDWAQVVYALARSGRLSEAADMVECMERGKEGFPAPDSRMYVLLVREMARQKGPFAASTLLSRTQAQGLIPDAVYFLLMVVVYSSATPPQLDRAKLYLRKGEELMRRQKFDFRMEVAEPLYLYTALMAGYSRLGRFRDTFSVLGILRQRKIRLSAVTFSILQRCCFSRLDAATDVRQLLRIMEQMGVTPETDNYNHLIDCYGQSGQMTLALQVANRMREAGISWNQITYLKLIKAVVASGQVELALRLLTRMRSDGVRPGAPHYTCAFIGLAREGYYEDASRVFQRLVELGGAKDPFAWNMMMAIECRRGDMDAAMEVLESMKEAGWPPNITSYSIMLEGYTGISDWPSALALRDTVLDLRQSLIRIAKDPVATEAAASAAKLELNLTATWTKVYHLLVDAAVYNAEWTRGVAFIEELTELGLPVNYYKHARLLQDVSSSARHLAAQGDQEFVYPDWNTEPESAKVQLRAQRRWSSQVPNVQKGIVAGAQGRVLESERQEASLLLPPHVFSASFYPSWLDGADGEMEEHLDLKLWKSCRKQIQNASKEASHQVSPRTGHEILYVYHHATVHRRPLVSVSLPPSRPLIGRTLPESLETLRELFETTGWPGQSGAVYVFMRPGAAKLDAFLAMLAAAAAYPEDVFLLRSEDPGDAANLALECRERKCRSMSFFLSSTLKHLPAAVLVNRRFLVANSSDVIKTKCGHFEESFRRALVHQPIPGEMQVVPDKGPDEEDPDEEEKKKERGDAASVWVSWLRRNRLHQMIRYDGNNLRLDGVMHRPALSKGESFRARAQKGGEVSVDLALPEMPDEDGPGSFLAWF